MHSRQLPSYFILCFLLPLLYLTGCASSPVSRDAAANVDLGRQNAQNILDNISEGEVADRYQNANQTTKGALLGGGAGAVAGALTSGVGAVPGAATGALFGASYGKFIDTKVNLRDQLKNRGANIVVLGDQILIVIPSARLFKPMSSTIKPEAYSTLQLLTQFINRYTKMLVKVAAYTNDNGSSRVAIALSEQQAQSVAKLLLLSGMDARLVYANGYGGTHLVANNSLDWDESDNYRIEITLEKLYV